MRTIVVACLMSFWPLAAAAQPQACSSPAFEARLVAAVARGEVAIKSVPAARAQDYARCYAREACAKLNKIEFEMYALSAISSYGDDKAEKEYLGRMRQHRKENNDAGDKVSPRALEDFCKREIGLK